MENLKRRVAITTEDNPYNPIHDFQRWYGYDLKMGYDTSGYLARIAKTSKGLTAKINEKIIEDAIDEIVKLQVGPAKYKKIVEEQ